MSSDNFQASLWADVGGTFTDCFVISGERRRQLKVLSSGIVRGQLHLTDGKRSIVASFAHPTTPHFWNTAAIRVIHQGKCCLEATVVVQTDSQSFEIDRVIPLDIPTRDCVIELDAGLEAPVLAAHLLLGVPIASALPPIDVRLGTTRGTNALLTRRGAKVGLVTTRGFKDCLEIGEQNRPDLFELEIVKPEPLTRDVIEVDERLTAAGEILIPLDRDSIIEPLRGWKESGVTSIAICLLHAHVNDVHEKIIADVVREIGFKDISVSSEAAPMIKLVARAETTVLDAYLTPILSQYSSRLQSQFNRFDPSNLPSVAPESRLRFMTSGGNLVDAASFRGAESILSGPAGGVVALAKLADAHLPGGAIGLDMGGTSTDVSRYSGTIPRDYGSTKAGVRVLTPMMAIHTVAAGGGSLCDVVDGRMTVGPQSAGAMPGPACYGRGGPLTVSDLNVILGRLPQECFPFPLDMIAAKQRLREVNAKLGDAAFASEYEAAEGFWRIAITHMAEAVRTISTARGSDPREFALVGFGGAAGGHVCAVADSIGMKLIYDDADASLLSALGIGLADVGRIRTRGVYQVLGDIDEQSWSDLCDTAESEATAALAGEADSGSRINVRLETDLRYQGTEATLTLPLDLLAKLPDQFHTAHRDAYGYAQPDRRIEVATIRCEATLSSKPSVAPERNSGTGEHSAAEMQTTPTAMFIGGKRFDVPLIRRQQVPVGAMLHGPCIVVDENSTLVIDPNWRASKDESGGFCIERVAVDKLVATMVENPAADLVTVEVVARRMQGIADAMGEVLRRTAASVNVRQRLDFSCAIFTADGQLIANAPHVPVHLGAMGHTVRAICDVFPQMSDGDVYVSNNPYAGGSHLPDVTVVTPVFCSDNRVPDFYVASRAHHAEIGGKTPGSMPPDGKNLAEEGVVIDTFALRRSGHDATDELRRVLSTGLYPSRDPETNLADIAAQQAAGQLGINYLRQLVVAMGLAQVHACVEALFELADGLVARWIETLSDEPMSFRDELDDGTAIVVTLTKAGERLRIDFNGTSPIHPGCFNATPGIVTAATIYVLRCVIGGTLPMNDGILRRIDLNLPTGLLNPQRGNSPATSPAVVAGNVETSMRVVDCLLGALGLVAASQGTMNNVLIGDQTFGYYETIGGGAGAGPNLNGASGVHTHMTNTRITDPEIYESRYPVRLWQFAIREGSGGAGANRGGDGLVREIEFLKPLSLSLITDRRSPYQPWGAGGGDDGQSGENILVRSSGEAMSLAACVTMTVEPHDRLILKTPGGGGFGKP